MKSNLQVVPHYFLVGGNPLGNVSHAWEAECILVDAKRDLVHTKHSEDA